ncbi:MAG TPA: ribosome small subunit-dependent GTPase A [Actinomycetes bacterium]|jgi:ribosome biogenesis GTPase|nr:ribosome small subunit-dependent GTPase A [Actinomycetes bacterium]
MRPATVAATLAGITQRHRRNFTPGLEALGWGPFFATSFEPYAREGHRPGRVVAAHRGAYVVAIGDGEVTAAVTGRLRHQAAGPADLPAVGDWVCLQGGADGGRASVVAVLPRRSAFSRHQAGKATQEQVVAANVDVVFLVVALTGDLKPRWLERYLTMAWESGATPVVVLTKADLSDAVDEQLTEAAQVAPGVDVHAVSAVTGQGLDELAGHLEGGQTVALLGSSGVGKSTLVNHFLGREVLATAEVRADGRGRHTTTHRELFRLPGGGMLVDTPGMRELQLWSAEEGAREAFDDIDTLAAGCRFSDCRHEAEPGCAVRRAVEDGELPADRLAGWHKLQRELRALEIRHDQRARAEQRRRWRVVNKAMRDHAKRTQ